MTWRTTLRPDAQVVWANARLLTDAENEAWITDEIEGRGLSAGRDPVEPVDVFREAWAAGGAPFQARFGAAIVAHFVRRFDAAGDPLGLAGDGRRALHLLTDAVAGLGLIEQVKGRFERGIYAEWAGAETPGLVAPHPLRQAFAAAVLKHLRPRGAPLRRLLADPALVNLAFGSLSADLSVSIQYLPVALPTLLAMKGARALRTHLVVLKEGFGALAVENALQAVVVEAEPRRFLEQAMEAAGLRSSLPILLDPERSRRVLGGTGGTGAADRLPVSVLAGGKK
ncbi:MAG: hypothetical protein Q8P41_32515 [Pseudomonadota bacterium]|nr:hypothetical protein [Pseudomonadota bacterium]